MKRDNGVTGDFEHELILASHGVENGEGFEEM
jgi:hypothetical protein